jgi:hypothetical protein
MRKTNWFLSAKRAKQTQEIGQQAAIYVESNPILQLARRRQVGE